MIIIYNNNLYDNNYIYIDIHIREHPNVKVIRTLNVNLLFKTDLNVV